MEMLFKDLELGELFCDAQYPVVVAVRTESKEEGDTNVLILRNGTGENNIAAGCLLWYPAKTRVVSLGKL